MSSSLVLVVIFMIATLAALVAGLVLMVRGGKLNKKYSNKLMQARIWFQAGAILVIFLLLLASK